jgi:diguanylate cyclase (GGDEF)-like protein/PAS domain S-box-containing protein
MEQSAMTQIDQTLLHHLPIALLLLDPDGRISWLNDTMSRLLGLPAAELLGRPTAELPESAQRLLSGEAKLLHIAETRRWVNREIRRGEDGQRLLIAQDVTAQEELAEENARLRQRVEDLKLTDELTGLPNKRAISQALDLHISRSRRYQNPLSTVLVHIDLQTLAKVQPLSTEPAILAVSRFLRDRLRWVDQIARWEDNVFLLVLPETTEADARGLLEKISNEQAGMALPGSFGDRRPRLTFGLACWKKGDDMRTLLRQALTDLQHNSAI